MPSQPNSQKNVMLYCNRADVKNKTIQSAITQATWTDQDVDERILESYNYINALLVPTGYLPADLIKSDFIRNISIMYTRYAILRDIYTGYAPSNSDATDKWKKTVDENLAMLVSGQMSLIDAGNVPIEKTGTDGEMRITINTAEVKRMVTLDDSSTWNTDLSNYSEDTIGL